MKKLTKLALALGIAAVGASTLAAQVTLVNEDGEPVIYDYSTIVVESGDITINGVNYVSGVLPGFEPGDRSCDPTTTTEINGACVANLSAVCGVNTIQQGGQCVGEAPDLTPPTLGITSSPSSMGDGVSTATLTFQFSRPVVNFAASDVNISPSGHSLTNFTQVNDSRWTATLNRSGNTSGTVTVSVSAGTYEGTNGVSGGSGTRSISLTGGSTSVGNCGPLPSNVELTNHAGLSDWGTTSSLREFRITNGKVFSHQVSTGSNPNGAGKVKMFGDSGTSTDRRSMWISECPGGPVLNNALGCTRAGGIIEITWAQRFRSGSYCTLETNKQYYLNMGTDATCNNGGCWARSQHWELSPLN